MEQEKHYGWSWQPGNLQGLQWKQQTSCLQNQYDVMAEWQQAQESFNPLMVLVTIWAND